MKYQAEQISIKQQHKLWDRRRPNLFRKIPRSWSLCGRCSGRSGGTFLTSDFLSIDQGLQVSDFCYCLPLKHQERILKRDVMCTQYLWCVWLKVHWEEAVSLVSAKTHRCRTLLQERVKLLRKVNKQDKVTSFSTSRIFTKLSGKTPFLPPISPIHQPASAQSWTTDNKVFVLN